MKDITGQKFNRLTIIKYLYTNHNYKPVWLCRCDCGNEKEILGESIKSGKTKSCGCRQLEAKNIKHGKTNSRLYECWQHMKRRCYNKKMSNYKYYGRRGIKVCKEWRSNFEIFYDWAMKNGYKENLEIDRIDVNGNYEPNNCKWSTRKEQCNNKRNNYYIEYKRQRKTLTEWADILNIKVITLYDRLNKLQWTIEKALNTPVKVRNKK